jgi:hypothetical protein
MVQAELFAGRWNVSLQVMGYPRWTSPPSKDYEVRLSVGYHLPALGSAEAALADRDADGSERAPDG